MNSKRRSEGGGLSLKTLLIAAASSAVASVVIPKIWEPGTVFAAAMSPVIVALVSETLKRPVEAVSSVRVRRTASGAAILDPPPAAPPRRGEPFDPLAPAPTEELEAALAAPQARPPRRVEPRRRGLSARQWKLALITGLVAFFAAAAVVTASELAIFGDSIGNGQRRTTYFGGHHTATKTATPTPTQTATPYPSASATPTPTVTPTATPSATPTPTPTVTETPQGATPTPTPTVAPTP